MDKEQNKVSAIAIVAPTIAIQIILLIVSALFMEFFLEFIDAIDDVRLVNAIVWSIILFPEIYLQLPKIVTPHLKINVGITGRIIPYFIWIFCIFDSLVGVFTVLK